MFANVFRRSIIGSHALRQPLCIAVNPTARTGQKMLRRKRIGHRVAAWYPPKLASVLPGVHEVLAIDPSNVLKREKRAARARKGKGPQKKGESRRKGR